MKLQVAQLADKVWDQFQQKPEDRRFLVAIAGIPGSGKTTLSQKITSALNARHATLHPEMKESNIAVFVPMDGYHYTRKELDAMSNPVEAHAKRGAEWTFDAVKYLALIKSLRVPLSPSTQPIYAPSFDHAVKDPKENDIPISPGNRIVVFEGNYVCLDHELWREAAEEMDERWFVDVEDSVARERLVKRHVKAGIAKDEVEAGKRADENDLLNGKFIQRKKFGITETVLSKYDEEWMHE